MSVTFKTYLQRLDTAITTGGNFSAALFPPNPNDHPLPPGSNELLSFLTKLKVALATETRKGGTAKDAAQVTQRRAAMDVITNFVTDTSAPISFSNIDKYAFAFQLALRVRSPRLINQDQTTLCGPVAIVFDKAKRDPVSYVTFAISLFKFGYGTFAATQITPSATIRSGYKGFLPEADYVVLASLRDTDAIVISTDILRNIFTLTKPGALCQFLERAGYRNIQDHTFLNLSVPLRILNAVTPFGLNAPGSNPFSSPAVNLQAAATELGTGRFIVMNAEGYVSNYLVATKTQTLTPLTTRTDPLPADQTHWTAVRKLVINPNTVRIKIITWGGSYEGLLPKDALLSRYAGYVSADP